MTYLGIQEIIDRLKLLTIVIIRPEMSSSASENCTIRHHNNDKLSTDSSDIAWGMAEINQKLRLESGQAGNMLPSRPLSMKLFASWEVESSSSSCVPR